jgi:hypothetical protein
MKKRDKTKVYKINIDKKIESENELNKEITEVSSPNIKIPSMFYDDYDDYDYFLEKQKTPTESFRFEIIDLSDKREVEQEVEKGVKLKLIL